MTEGQEIPHPQPKEEVVQSVFNEKQSLPSKENAEKLPSKYLITMYEGIGDAVIALAAVDQLVKDDPQSLGRIDVLCNPVQAEIFSQDPRINQIIVDDESKLKIGSMLRTIINKKLFFKKSELLNSIKEKKYELIYGGLLPFTLLRNRNTRVAAPNIVETVQGMLALRKFKDRQAHIIARAAIDKFLKGTKNLEPGQATPLYLREEDLIEGKKEVEEIKQNLGLSKNGKLLVVATDSSSPVSSPTTNLLAKGIGEALARDSSLGVCILPSYTDKEASARLRRELEPENPGKIYSYPAEPRPSLLVLSALLDQSDIVISGDTGIAHLAAAEKRINNPFSTMSFNNNNKIIILFGGTNPAYWGHSERTIILGRGRKEQKKYRPGLNKAGYKTKGRDYFSHIHSDDLTREILTAF